MITKRVQAYFPCGKACEEARQAGIAMNSVSFFGNKKVTQDINNYSNITSSPKSAKVVASTTKKQVIRSDKTEIKTCLYMYKIYEVLNKIYS